MKHGGNIYRFANQISCLPEQVLDFSANINPEQALDWHDLQLSLTPYADPEYGALKQALHQRYCVPVMADSELYNGASAAIFALLTHLKPRQLILYTPVYAEYERVAQQLACQVHAIDRFGQFTDAELPKHSTVIFVNPATPDGTCYEMEGLLASWQAADCTIIIDESFLDFCYADSVIPNLAQIKNLYVIKSLSKFYGCAGIRIGFVSAEASLIHKLKQQEPAWKLSSFDMAYMQAALANSTFIEHTRRQTRQLRELLHSTLEQSGLFDRIYPGQANFLLARLAKVDGYALQQHLAKACILIRICDTFEGLDQRYVRFAVKDAQAIETLGHSLRNV
jgi:threonine-phosphate decarboxylase